MSNATTSLETILADAETAIDKVYEALNMPDLTDAEEDFLNEQLRLVVQRRDLTAAALRQS